MQLVKNTAFGLARVQNFATFTVCMHPPREIFFFLFFLFFSKKSTRLSVLCAYASVCYAIVLFNCMYSLASYLVK